MALTKTEKKNVIDEVAELLNASKLTVVAKYEGTSVKAMQALRRDAKGNGTRVKVVKNRLVMQALKQTDKLKDADTSALTGMLLYAFNSDDEVAPAQSLNNFAKTNSSLQFVGAIDADGNFMEADQVKALAVLPSKNELLAGLINLLNSPVKNVTNALSGDIHGLLQGLEAKAAN